MQQVDYAYKKYFFLIFQLLFNCFFMKKLLLIFFYIQYSFPIEEMGCGVAMTVLQTKELIKIENSNKISNSILRTNNNILKASQTQSSITMIKKSPIQAKNFTENINRSKMATPLKEKSIVKQEQKKQKDQNHIQQKQHSNKKTQNLQIQASAKVSTVQQASIKIEKPKQTQITQEMQTIKSSRFQNKFNNQQNVVMKKSAAEAQISAKELYNQYQQKSKPEFSKPIYQKTQRKSTIKQAQALSQNFSKEKGNHRKNVHQKVILTKKVEHETNQKKIMTKRQQKGQKSNIQILAQKRRQLSQSHNQNDSIIKKKIQPTINSQKKQLIKIQPLNSPRNIGSKPKLDKKISENKSKEETSRKTLKVKKEMVHLDSLYLQSIITKPEQPELEKQNNIVPKPPIAKKEEVYLRVPQGCQSKNTPIQIVDNLVQVEKNLDKPNIIPKTAVKKLPDSKASNPKVTEQQHIRRITEQKKKGNEERKALQSRQRAEDQRFKADQLRRIQQAKKKILQQQKKSLEMETNKLKKVYNV